MPKIGLRNLKTALSVVICAITISILNSFVTYELTYFYAGIAAVFTLQQTHEGSKDRGKGRFWGTIIGMIVSIGVNFIRYSVLEVNLEFIFLFIAIVMAIYLVNYFQLSNGTMIACIMVIASFDLHTDDYIAYSIIRALETGYGVIIALYVNKYIMPYKQKS